MIYEQLEFAISQYLDGTLPPEERIALEAVLQKDAEARRLLEEYRKLDATLKQTGPLPNIAWDRLATRISDAVAEQDEQATAPTYSFSWGWKPSLAMAASLLIAIGVATTLYLNRGGETRPVIAQVTGPQEQPAVGQVFVEVSIGPATALARQQAAVSYAEGVIAQPSRIVIASGTESGQDILSIY